MSHIDIDPILGIVKQAIPIAKLLAGLTATQWDDRAVGILESAANSPPLIQLLRVIFDDPEVNAATGHHRNLAIVNALAHNVTDEQEAAIAAAGFTWRDLLTYLPLVLRILFTVAGKRG